MPNYPNSDLRDSKGPFPCCLSCWNRTCEGSRHLAEEPDVLVVTFVVFLDIFLRIGLGSWFDVAAESWPSLLAVIPWLV